MYTQANIVMEMEYGVQNKTEDNATRDLVIRDQACINPYRPGINEISFIPDNSETESVTNTD